MLAGLKADLRYAFRNLRRNCAFTAVAIGALAIGIGANTAVFTVVESVLLRPLPYREPSRLYTVRPLPKHPTPFGIGSMSDPQFIACRSAATAFAQLAAHDSGNWNATGIGDPVAVHGQEVTTNFFDTLGVQPQLGRGFLPEEGSAARAHVAVLGNAFWLAHFAGGRDVLGKRIVLDGEPHTVVGVMPAGFDPTSELWIPAVLDPNNHHIAFRQVIGRLAPRATLAHARAELDAANERVTAEEHGRHGETEMVIAPLRDSVVGNARPALLVFLGAVGCVLLIACVNVANLLLARASARRQEIAIRASLGATRWRLGRQLLTESAVLGVIGGLLGLIVALWGVETLIQLAPANRIPRLEEIRFDVWVFVFNIGVSLVTSVLFGLAPALQLTRARQTQNWKDAASRGSARSGTLRSVLVMAEVALALVLLIGAGLLVRSFERLRGVNLGFRPDNVLAVSLQLNGKPYESAAQIQRFDNAVLERIARVPGVTAAGLVNWLPMSDALVQGDFKLGDQQLPPDVIVAKPAVSPGYFRAMGIPLVRGRAFDEHDTLKSAPVAMVDEAFARRFWPRQDPIGKRISFADHPEAADDWMTVVGVAGSIRQENPAAEHMTIYQPAAQVQAPFFLQWVSFVVRSQANTSSLAPALRAQVWSVDKDLPIREIARMRDLLYASTAEPRFQTRVLASFSTIAFLLAIIGVYGVIAYSVTQRTSEIGIRMAMGAQRSHIVQMILRRSAALVAGGLVIGLAGAWAVTRVLKNFLFEVTPFDPPTFAAVSLLLALVALVACYIPARRAAAIDPLVALRYE
ncbi:MAG TPA: ABC transporter permease [Bryobacteraceae bacterium]|nr:ABC transporter permease [Bryobacteraceae bacterium]